MVEEASRIPPHDLDAEHAVLGAAMSEPDVPAMVAGRLLPTDFYTESHRVIYRRILELHEAERSVDRITVAAELRAHDELDAVGGVPKLFQLIEAAHIPAFVPGCITVIIEASFRRTLIKIGRETEQASYDATTPGQVLGRLREQLDSIERRLGSTAEPLPLYTWSELVARQREKVNYLWPGWAPEKKVLLVAGAGDSLKSFLCTFLVAMVAAGRPALEPDDNNNPCAQGPAIIVSAENGIDEDTRRVQLIHRGHELPDDLPVTILSADNLSLRDVGTWASFTAKVETIRPRLIVIDSGISVADLENENDNAAVAAFMKKCVSPLARTYGAAVLLIVHSPKPPTQRGSLPFTDEHVARGASAWRNAADGVLYLKRDKSLGKDAVILRPAKVRTGFRHKPIWFRIDTTDSDEDGQPTAVQVRYGGEFAEETGKAEEAAAALATALPAAIAILKQTPGSRTSKLVDALEAAGISEGTARRAVDVLRGKKPWPNGPYTGKKQAVVDEAPGPRKAVFLTFNPSMESAVTVAPPTDEDEVPF